jgi:segregation and condensation protein B
MMLRVEAAVFASPKPVAREALVRLVGEACRFDDLIADLIHELRGRPYDLTLVAGGYTLRTKTRFAPAIRAAHPGFGRDDVADLTRTETFALTAIALSAAGDAGGDFETGRTGDQPRRDRRLETTRLDRRRDPRP